MEKPFMFIGFSIVNHPFWAIPICGIVNNMLIR